jgi:multidrug efflux pump subunit AcrA (membrane-fusion protein)
MANEEKYYDPSEHEPMPEGEEDAPPLTHTMSVVRWAILAGMTLFAVIMVFTALGFTPWQAQANDNVQYHCPMHPTYISSQSGDCPICGMSLVPINSEGKELASGDKPEKAPESGKAEDSKADEQPSATYYVCPMHPEVTSDKPGECHKCGMDLVKTEKPAKASEETTYVCPMHPDVTSNNPGECPKCGMDLVPVKARASSLDSAAVVYACPMHPEVTSDKQGECPKCGMDLVKVEDNTKMDTKGTKPADPNAKYFCPMHPEVTSDKPGRCPKCKMFLEPVKEESKQKPGAATSGHEGHSGAPVESNEQASVPGLAPVTIEPGRLQLINVTTAPVQRRALGIGTEIVGFVTSAEDKTSNVNSRVSGWVDDLFVDQTGQYVEKDAPLMSLYSQDLYQAQQDFLAARDAINSGPIDPALKSMREDIYSAARQRLRLLGLSNDQVSELEQTDLPSPQMMIRSPVSGYVLMKNVLAGQYFTPDQNLFTIADLNEVWVIGDVYEQDIPAVRKGAPVSMTLTAFPGERFEGKIGFIYPTVSSQTRTMKVRMQFPNESLRLRPGMYAEVEIERGAADALAIPREAVLDNGDIQYAFVVHDGTHFVPTRVELGRTTDDYAEVRSGLKEGDLVVTSANFLIDSESRLKAAIAGMTGDGMEMPAQEAPSEHIH